MKVKDFVIRENNNPNSEIHWGSVEIRVWDNGISYYDDTINFISYSNVSAMIADLDQLEEANWEVDNWEFCVFGDEERIFTIDVVVPNTTEGRIYCAVLWYVDTKNSETNYDEHYTDQEYVEESAFIFSRDMDEQAEIYKAVRCYAMCQ